MFALLKYQEVPLITTQLRTDYKNRLGKGILLVALFLAVSSCAPAEEMTSGSVSTGGDETSTSVVDTAAMPEDEASDDGGELGTIVGSPTGTKNSMLTIKTLSATDATSEDSSDEKCRSDSGENANPNTQKCVGTPQEYLANISAIYLVSCLDGAGLSVACNSPAVAAIGERVPVHTKDLTELKADDAGATIEISLVGLDTERGFGGLQFVTQFIEQKFPSDSDPDADRITAHLRGKAYRMCTTPHDVVSQEDMAALCGQAEARRGDLLFDIDGDGAYGFADVDMLAADAVTETVTRPDRYEIFVALDLVSGTRAYSGHPEFEYSDGASFGGVAGYFAPIFSFASVTSISPDASYDVTASLDFRNTFEFKDGAVSHGDADICVEALADEACPNGDDDPASVGQYNPFYDGLLVFKTPTIDVTFAE